MIFNVNNLNYDTEYSGKDVNNCGFELYLLTDENEISRNDHKYIDGLNVEESMYAPSSSGKGFWVLKRSELLRYKYYIGNVKYIRKVELLEDSKVYIGRDLLQTNKFVLGPRKIFNVEDYYDNNMFIEIIKSNPANFYLVPDSYKTEELCLLSVPYLGDMLQYVPDKLKTKQMCLLAVNNNYYAFIYIPDIFKTREMCEAAVKINPIMLKYVPDSMKTYKMCLRAVSRGFNSLKFVPSEIKDAKICRMAVKNNIEMVKYAEGHI